ncbi:hypothetical protein N665_0002s0038 [Sinapis alba]|nr:hypothetical protein N665_0002s0038 [Sinapis alba]
MGLLKKKHPKHSRPTFKGILTAILATHAAIFLLILAGLSISGTLVAFIATMPLFIVFSPILVPAGITTGLLTMGLAASGGSGLTALSIISWLYKKLTVKELPENPVERSSQGI